MLWNGQNILRRNPADKLIALKEASAAANEVNTVDTHAEGPDEENNYGVTFVRRYSKKKTTQLPAVVPCLGGDWEVATKASLHNSRCEPRELWLPPQQGTRF